jgi:hypothetical protein
MTTLTSAWTMLGAIMKNKSNKKHFKIDTF